MKSYKIVPNKDRNTDYAIYEQSFIFFWKKVGHFDTYQSKITVVEQACLFIQSKKPIYFDA